MSRTLFDGLNKQTEYESKLAICEHAGESTVPKELTSFSAPPLSIRGVNLLANLQLRVFVSPFYQMARRVRSVDRAKVGCRLHDIHELLDTERSRKATG